MFARNTEGLCGFMDDDDTNDLTGPNGEQYNDTIEFAESCKYHSGLQRAHFWYGGGQKVSQHVPSVFPADERDLLPRRLLACISIEWQLLASSENLNFLKIMCHFLLTT